MAILNLRNSVSFLTLAAFAAGAQAQEASTKPPQTLPPVIVKKEQTGAAKRRQAEKKKAPAPAAPAAEARPAAAALEPPPGAADENVVYSANRVPTDITKVGSAVDVITAKQIGAQSRTYVQDYLAQTPGMSLAQTGPQGTASYAIWGASSQYIKVLVDGMDLGDPTGTQTRTALENILAGDVSRIEVLKGSQSLLYGGQAVGGVISIDTAKPALGASFDASGETGAYNTQRGMLGAAYGSQDGWARFSVQSVRSDGYSAFAAGREDDSYRNLTFSGTGEYKLSNDVKVFFTARSIDTNARLDAIDFGFGPDGWLGNSTVTSQQAGRLGTEFKLFEGALINTVSVQGMKLDRKQNYWADVYDNYTGAHIYSGPTSSSYGGDRWKVDYLGVAKVTNWATLTVGADHQVETARVLDIYGDLPGHEAALNGVFGQVAIEPIKGLTLAGGGRNDDHSTFGDHQTYRFTGAYFYDPTQTKLRASTGTGFRAPSLYELYAPVNGNSSLQPEESKSWDAGFDQWFDNRRFRLSGTYFQIDTTNEIQWVETDVPYYFAGHYIQIPGTTHREGVELSGAAALTSFLSLSASYTYVDARQDDGARLPRVPRNSIAFGADALLFDTIKANVTARVALDTVDVRFPGLTPLQDYVLLNAKLSYDIRPGLTTYIRGENLLDQRYQTAYRFNTPGLSVYGGLSIHVDEQNYASLK
jgi:vitamin B12 transporter